MAPVATPAPATAVIPTIATTAAPSVAASEAPSPAATASGDAYAELLKHIPAPIAQYCEEFEFTQSLPAEPGETAEADCTLTSDGLASFVTYHQFADAASMNSFFDTQRLGRTNGGGTVTGPGCGQGPGQGTWASGRKDCYMFITNDAQVTWTHDALFIVATAFRDSSDVPTTQDWAQLEQFWQSAGPTE